ncbi:MAG: hypothetical protein LCH37_08290 [Bacteroidetes bacterium]|nr:hypothetical protein [Bacteroidota bacterium]
MGGMFSTKHLAIELTFSLIGDFFFLLFISCGNCTKQNEKENFTNPADSAKIEETIVLSENVILKRFAIPGIAVWDILEINGKKVDSLPGNFLLDLTEQNIHFNKTKNSAPFVIFNNYLIFSKDQVQVVKTHVYYIGAKKKLASFQSEDIWIDTTTSELIIVHDRGIIRNYFLKYKLANEAIFLVDSIPLRNKFEDRIKQE